MDIALNHPFIALAPKVKAVCSPLELLNIDYFSFLRKHEDASEIYLSNSAGWVEDYYAQKLYISSFFENEPHRYQTGFFLWTKSSVNLPVFSHAESSFDSNNGIVLINRCEGYSDFYFFSTSIEDGSIINFYLKNLDLLERFARYFKSEANAIIKQADKSRIVIPERFISVSGHVPILSFSNNREREKLLRKEFIQKTKIKKFYFSKPELKDVVLTGRELDCALCLVQRKTAMEIGKELFISNRTVEVHLANLKSKLNCQNKNELIDTLLDNGLDFQFA